MTKCNPHQLSVMSYANGFTLWNYIAESGVYGSEPGFFNELYDMLRTGDWILFSSPDLVMNSDGSLGTKSCIYVVTQNFERQVEVVKMGQ